MYILTPRKSDLNAFLVFYKVKVINVGIPNMYVEQGNVDILKKELGLTAENIVNKITEHIEVLS